MTMIDTIKLTLGKNMFHITDISLFQKDTMNATRGWFTLVQNPTKTELRNGIIKPRLTLTKRYNFSGRFEPTLAIEVSLPKLVFKNNFDELIDANFQDVAETLQKRLKEMGVLVFYEVLVNSPVSAIHYSKNIPLTDGTTPYHYIKEISKGNYPLSLDTDKADYRNNSQLFKLHVNSWELIVYDKIKEFEKAKVSEKRSIENDNAIQLDLFKTLPMKRPFEVLRIEPRLNKQLIIKKIFKTLEIDVPLTFQNLFNSKISQAVLLYYLDYIEQYRPMLLDYNSRDIKSLLPDIIVNNPNFSMSKQFMLYGLKQAMDMYDMRDLRKMFGKQKNREWYRLIDKSTNIHLPKIQDTFGTLRKHLTEFKPLKLVDFQNQMLNNDKYTQL